MMVEKSSENKKLKSELNTGSSEYQIERFTNRIKLLTEHLKINKKRSQHQKRFNEACWKKEKTLNLRKEEER